MATGLEIARQTERAEHRGNPAFPGGGGERETWVRVRGFPINVDNAKVNAIFLFRGHGVRTTPCTVEGYQYKHWGQNDEN